jgi:hypothetical protein
VPPRPRFHSVRGIRSLALILLLWGSWSVLLAQPAGAQPGPLTATGTVIGTLKAGQTLQVRLVVRHLAGWQQVEEVEVDLQLRGVALEKVILDPTRVSAVIEGAAGPTALGDPTVLTGHFLSVNAKAIGFSARGNQLILTVPMQLRGTPPVGARLIYQARGFDGATTPVRALGPPAGSNAGFSWGTLAVAAAAALFVGGYVGSTFASRRRPPPRPSVYATVQRRLEQERSKP